MDRRLDTQQLVGEAAVEPACASLALLHPDPIKEIE